MTKTPMAPERYHERNHEGPPFEECRRCQRARAICRSKQRFETREAAQDAAQEVNEREAYASPVVRYRCRWCPFWHLTTARTGYRRKRVEKQRRRWLVAQVVAGLLVLSACAEPRNPSGYFAGVVTEKHHYPAHVKTVYTANCLPEVTGDRPQPVGCVKEVKTYDEHWEVCLKADTGTVTCYYVSEWEYRDTSVGRRHNLDRCCVDDPHPVATNEWDGQR